ncbi:MAG: acyl-ACP--UDP-N-acetylglucosamine O-acyltransferase [Arenimonas sp.]
MIHPTAHIDPGARLGTKVSVGAFTIIGADVDIGDGTSIGPHCVINGPTRIGSENRIYSHAALGIDPQDKKFGEERSELHIGDRNTIREFTTFSRGTAEGGSATSIGDDNWIMAYVHIAHDCRVGSQTIFANNATLGGHAIIEDWAILGGFVGVHQFCRIGAHAFIGMGCLINADVPPFVMVADRYPGPRGINVEGLKRRGFDADRIASIKRAYRAVFVSGKPLGEARQELAESARDSDDVRQMLDFIERSERGVLR